MLPDLTQSLPGYLCIVLFVLAYVLVLAEDRIGLHKSKPVVLAAGAIWVVIAIAYRGSDEHGLVAEALRHSLLDYAELMLFLIAAMTYVNTLSERQVFSSLSTTLVQRGFGFRAAFWATGVLAFWLSPIVDNLTTSLVLGAVVVAIGSDSPRFMAIGCVNIVVAANAGGAFSPFGDITTLMVWQAGELEFAEFFALLLPSAASYLVPAAIMHFWIPDGAPPSQSENITMKSGAWAVMLLFALTLATAVVFHQVLELPPFLGMMTGLGYLQLYDYALHRREKRENAAGDSATFVPFNVFNQIARSEWDTLLFFYGVIVCVEGLGFMGYMHLLSSSMYDQFGATLSNITVGLLSGIVDNIPIMVSVLEMSPAMPHSQWLLVTLTAGIGGSLFSIGSAAGVALMGQARGVYTFSKHLVWTPVIALGYFIAVLLHLWRFPAS